MPVVYRGHLDELPPESRAALHVCGDEGEPYEGIRTIDDEHWPRLEPAYPEDYDPEAVAVAGPCCDECADPECDDWCVLGLCPHARGAQRDA